MQVLIETRMNALRLTESKAPRKGCLGRLEGVCADFKNPTRNGRLYPLELWKKVFNDTLFKEALKNKTLFGELDHPEDRFEPLMRKACIVMTDYRIDEDEGLIYGGFDILDTPDGRVLKNILDYGSVLGVSSRGQGDIIECADGERVDEDSYDFACFDVVSTPAVEKARQKVVESMKIQKKNSFKESINSQIEDAETVTDLNIIRSVVRTSDLTRSDMDTILESIEDKCQSLQVGETISTEARDCNIKSLKENTNSEKSAKTIRENRKLYKCIKGLREQISAYKHREKRYIECIDNKSVEIDSKNTELSNAFEKISRMSESLRQSKADVKRLNEKLESSRMCIAQKDEKIKTQTGRISALNESIKVAENMSEKSRVEKDREIKNVTEKFDRKLSDSKNIITKSERKVKHLQTENKSLQNKLDTMSKEKQSLKEKLNCTESDVSMLQEKLKESDNMIRELQENMQSSKLKHDSEVASIDREVDEYSNLLSEAQQKISDKNDTISELKESLKKSQSSLQSEKDANSKLKGILKKYQTSYVNRVSSVSGIEPDSIYHSITESTTPEQVEKMVDSCRKKLDRYNKLGISSNGIDTDSKYVVESLNTAYDSFEADEQSNLVSFLETTLRSL